MHTMDGLALAWFGILALVGCGGADDARSSGTQQDALACGSAALFASTHAECSAMDATGVAGDDGVMCRCAIGWAWDGTRCQVLGGCACKGADCGALSETEEACLAAHASCTENLLAVECGSAKLYASTHGACEAMDAVAAPDANGSSCYCALGYAWDGEGCVALSDCQCVGEDCDKLTQTREACEQAHAGC